MQWQWCVVAILLLGELWLWGDFGVMPSYSFFFFVNCTLLPLTQKEIGLWGAAARLFSASCHFLLFHKCASTEMDRVWKAHLSVTQHDHPHQDHVDVDAQRLVVVNLVHLRGRKRTAYRIQQDILCVFLHHWVTWAKSLYNHPKHDILKLIYKPVEKRKVTNNFSFAADAPSNFWICVQSLCVSEATHDLIAL